MDLSDDIYIEQALVLKEVKQAFQKLVSQDYMESFYVIDIIQRLGIEHHFQEEIEALLQNQCSIFISHISDFANHHKLYELALLFRLLRQRGYHVPADVFEGLKSNKREFRAKYGEDVKSLIALHEAAQLSIEGEDSLDDAGFLCCQLLHSWLWPMACFTDPRFSDQRIELTKSISLIYIIDDIFDVYGTLDQLTLFRDAVYRWELGGAEQLPDFMKMCLTVLYDITNDFAEKVYKRHGLNPIDTLKRSWVRLLNAFMEEAHWLKGGDLPRSEEYLNNGIVSSGVHVVLLHAFFLFDQSINMESVAVMDNFPQIVYSVAKILRLSDDLEGAKKKDEKGVDGSYLDCYMNEHQHVSAEDAQNHVSHLIQSEWKRLNEQILTQNELPSSFTNFCLNAARMVPLMYDYTTNNPCLSIMREELKMVLKT